MRIENSQAARLRPLGGLEQDWVHDMGGRNACSPSLSQSGAVEDAL